MNAIKYIMKVTIEKYHLKVESYFPSGILTNEQWDKMCRLTKNREKKKNMR